jgi:hypothetical protein
MEGHRTAERRSRAYHAAIAGRLAAEPNLLAAAQQRVDGWRVSGAVHRRYVDAWRVLLAAPHEELVARLGEDSDQMNALRQVSPFAGALDARTRWKIWRSVA